MTPSWYDVLDIESTASADEIRAAWRSAIADLEPGSRRFQSLNQAAEVLLDEQKRAAYDAERSGRAPTLTPRELDREDARITREVSKDQARERREVSKGEARERRREEKLARQHQSTVHEVRPRTIPTWLLAALGVAAAVCVAAAIWVWQTGDDTAVEDATGSAQSAAEQAIVPVLSYDYETLEADQKRAQSYMTADYREGYDELFGVVMDNAPSTQTKVVADAFASAIVRSGEDRVDILIFVDQLTTNKLTPQPVTYKNQVTVTMQKVGDDWLIDNLVTSPAAQ